TSTKTHRNRRFTRDSPPRKCYVMPQEARMRKVSRRATAAGALAVAGTALILVGAPGFSAGAAAQSARPQATFTKDVAPILQRSCQNCHRPGSIGPMALLTYE